MTKLIFIVGSPRSGTTITGGVLGCHPKITTVSCPYYMMEKHHQYNPDDILTRNHITPESKADIENFYAGILAENYTEYIVDQSPRNSFRIDYLRHIFPQAKFIHVIRNPMDVVFSIKRESDKRVSRYLGYFRTPAGHKIPEDFSYSVKYNLKRWNGGIGWGVRFRDWDKYFAIYPTLQFNAMQCTASVKAVLAYDKAVNKFMRNRYEDFLANPITVTHSMLQFIDPKFSYKDLHDPPRVLTANMGKWKTVWGDSEIEEVLKGLKKYPPDLGYVHAR